MPKSCIIPELSAFYEITTFAREGGELIVEAYEVVGPHKDDPQYPHWQEELQHHLGQSGRVMQAVIKLPYPMHSVSPGLRRVYQDRAAFNPADISGLLSLTLCASVAM